MITAIDANIFLDILLPDPAFVEVSSNALERSATEGSLVVCGDRGFHRKPFPKLTLIDPTAP